MKILALLIALAIPMPPAAYAADKPSTDSSDIAGINNWRRQRNKFLARYYRWIAAIYDEEPSVNLSHTIAVRDCYTARDEYREIILLGKDALPFITAYLNAPQEEEAYGRYLGQAVMAITGWKESEFGTFASLPELNVMLTKRLISEKLIPAEAEPPSDKTK